MNDRERTKEIEVDREREGRQKYIDRQIKESGCKILQKQLTDALACILSNNTNTIKQRQLDLFI